MIMVKSMSAATPPSREGPRPSRVPVSTGGLFPRDYRARLRKDDGPFRAPSEFDSTTVIYDAPSPFIGTALHWSPTIRKDIAPKLSISLADRFYEEDPETHRFLAPLTHVLLPNQSRYEVDLNRPPDVAIYSRPELAWGKEVWGEALSDFEREFTMEKWYEFNTLMDCAVEDAIERFGFAVVFDFHSYNYQRDRYVDWRTDGKPVINLGTRHLDLDDRGRAIVSDTFASLRGHTVGGGPCLVEENGVFYGGYLNRRLNHLYGPRCITLSIEYKKVYMDERTGVIDESILSELNAQMTATIATLATKYGAAVRGTPSIPKTT